MRSTFSIGSDLVDPRAGPKPVNRFVHSEEADLELLEIMNEQAKRAPVPLIFSALTIGGLAYGKAPTVWIMIWVIAMISMQLFRLPYIGSLVRATDRPAASRLNQIIAVSWIHGLVVAASILLFFYMDGFSRSIYTMILVGVTAATITTSSGFLGPCIGYCSPIYLGLMIGWVFFPNEGLTWWVPYAVGILLILYTMFLFGLAKQTFASFLHRQRINAELQRALKAEKLASSAKTRFLASASHDLRQPLHTLSLLSAAMTMRPLDDKSASIAVSMNEAMSDLTSELDSLLDISKLDAGVVRVENEPVVMHKMLDRLTRNAGVTAREKGLEIRLILEDKPSVYSDKVLLERLLRNLLDNAIKYTKTGGIYVGLRQIGPVCEISIRDTGVGIDSSKHAQIFEEFFQVDNPERDRNRGLGLGLSIVSRIVSILKLKLQLDSKPGEGTEFRLELPAHTEPAVTDEVDSQDEAARISNRHVLLIEDDASVSEATQIVLEAAGCTVTAVTSTDDAVLAAKGQQPDVVLADFRLPLGDTGVKAIEQLRGIYPQLPAILVSGESNSEDIGLASNLGVTVLVKPVDKQSLFTEIKRVSVDPLTE